MATQTAWQEQALVVANRENGVPRRAQDSPLQTVVTQGGMYLASPPATADRPVQIDLRGVNAPRDSATEPLSTIHAGGMVHGLAYVVANYLPGWLRDAHRREIGTLTATDSHAVLTYRGPGDARSVDEPVSTVAATEQHALVDRLPDVEDCAFRMLQPHELKLASGFTSDYLLHGTKRDQVRQIGNAVTAPAQQELTSRVLAAMDA
jgi:DNA (cytosine-5)-methyltransferase 1